MFLMDNLCTHPFRIEKQKVTGACTARISASTEQMNALQKLYTGRLTGGVKLCWEKYPNIIRHHIFWGQYFVNPYVGRVTGVLATKVGPMYFVLCTSPIIWKKNDVLTLPRPQPNFGRFSGTFRVTFCGIFGVYLCTHTHDNAMCKAPTSSLLWEHLPRDDKCKIQENVLKISHIHPICHGYFNHSYQKLASELRPLHYLQIYAWARCLRWRQMLKIPHP